MNEICPFVQIVPYRSNNPDGVSDYSRILADSIYDNFQTKTMFVSASRAKDGLVANDRWPTSYLDAKSANSVLNCLENICSPESTVLLHYSGYGYQKRGIPWWLLEGLTLFLKSHPKAKLAVIFHELYASSSPLHSAFWLCWLQKMIAKKLLALSSVAITPCEVYAERLNCWDQADDKKTIAVPVFSTVGELKVNKVSSERKSNLIIFGRGHSRLKCYLEYADELSSFVRSSNVKEIVDIGPFVSGIPDYLGSCKIRRMGVLSSNEISSEMQSSRFGVLNYDRSRLGKSTVFAAYAAHGLQVVCFDESGDPLRDGLIEGRHLTTVLPLIVSERVSRNALSWYQKHNVASVARSIIRAIVPVESN